MMLGTTNIKKKKMSNFCQILTLLEFGGRALVKIPNDRILESPPEGSPVAA